MDESAYLPPFAALRAFQAAARHGQIREAAKDLGITESAVSHQVSAGPEPTSRFGPEFN